MQQTLLNKTKSIFFALFIGILVCASNIDRASAQNAVLPSPDSITFGELNFELPDTHRVVLDNGMVLHILENNELPVVNISALIRTGTMHDPAGKEGTAELTAYVMRTGGTIRVKSGDVDKIFDTLAAEASVTIAMESAQVNFSVLKKHLDEGLNLLAQILMYPAFETDKIELARQLKREEIRRLQDDPQKFAFREFNRLIFHDDARGRSPSLQSLENITRGDLVDFHKQFFMPNNILFAVSGDVSKEEAVAVFNRLFGPWRPGKLPAQLAAPTPASKPGIHVIHKDIPQSTIVSGLAAPSKRSPEFYPFTVLDFILGSGGFSSRIVSLVRSHEGLAYSAGSFYRARPEYGLFGNYTLTKTTSTMRSLSLLHTITTNLTKEPVGKHELAWAKNSINNGFIFSFSTPEQIVRQQMQLEFEKLPADYFLNYRKNIENVTLDDLSRVAATFLENAKAAVLILGDSKNFDHAMQPETYIFLTPEE